MAQNHFSTLLASAARTAQTASDTQTNLYYRGARVSVEVTSGTSGFSITPRIQVYDSLAEVWTTVLSGAAITAAGHIDLMVYPGCTAVSNVVLNQPLACKWRFLMDVADTKSVVYSVAVNNML